ncbi:transcription elongation factor A protein 3 isoform X17 [Brienomyrus brachyistius]|uniref:transcription elongation factor A protein 3 isoform X17 n=1 Tax=Brienomyrus brachyistius TaxID=42636 RepID=UPI0020B3D2A6|nr:transcription elongation factor A protein 3 isoform X17 [Brienomyrus brachyistius]
MTREEDLIRIAKKLDKMVSRNNTEGALDLLQELKGFNMTLKLLQDTRIGMSVNGIRKHCTDEEVVTLAKILIKNWKRLLETAQSQTAEKPKEKNRTDSKKSTAGDNEGQAGRPSSVTESRKDSTDDNKPPKQSNVETKKERKDSVDLKPAHPVKRHSTDTKPERRDSTSSKSGSGPPVKKITGDRRDSQGPKSPIAGAQQRKPSTDSSEMGNSKIKPETPKSPTSPTSPVSPSFSPTGGPVPPHLLTGDSVRDKCIEMLTAALRTDDDYKDFGVNCNSMAAEIEYHIYQEIKATDMKYKNRVRSRISNLKDPKNPDLRKNVLAGAIELSRIASMTAEEMASDELKQLRNTMTQEAIREHQMAKTGGTTTDLLQCGKCKKKNCTYNQVQTRSADEPMTTFVLCNECGNRWKFC